VRYSPLKDILPWRGEGKVTQAGTVGGPAGVRGNLGFSRYETHWEMYSGSPYCLVITEPNYTALDTSQCLAIPTHPIPHSLPKWRSSPVGQSATSHDTSMSDTHCSYGRKPN
jgi:hypothetical protein